MASAVQRVRRNLAYAAAFLMDVTFAVGSLASVYLARARFGATEADLGDFALIAAGTYVAASYIFGRLSDRWGRRVNIVVAAALNTLAFVLAPLASRLWQVYAAAMVYASGQGAFWCTIEADISDHSTPAELPHRLGRFNVAWTMGLGLGSLGGGYVGEHLGQTASFRLAAVLPLAALAAYLLRTYGPVRRAAGEREAVAQRSPSVAGLFWTAALILNFASTGLASTLRNHMPAVTGGARSGQGGLYMGLLFLAELVTFVVLARWRGWHYRAWPLVAGVASAVGGAAVWGLVRDPWVMGVGCLMAGVGCAVASNSSVYYSVGAAAGRGHRGGIHEAVVGAGGAMVPFVGGRLAKAANGQAALAWVKGVPHLTAGLFLVAAVVVVGSALRAGRRTVRRVALVPAPAAPPVHDPPAEQP